MKPTANAPPAMIGYLGTKDGKTVLTNWETTEILSDNVKMVASWPTPRSKYSAKMYQVECTVDGVTYTGRSGGLGMVWKGRPKAKPP